jgi:hypothetical protein
MPGFVKRLLTTATVAALAFATAGSGGAGAAAAASRATGPVGYSDQLAGYQATGRWFRYVATTVTVPPRALSYLNGGAALIGLNGRYPAWIGVNPGGGPDSVGYAGFNVGTGSFQFSPRVGDRLAISVYYDQRGHTFFTATDLTQNVTQTVVQYVGRLIYSAARLWVQTGRIPPVSPPAADTRLWQFTGSRLTTYSGDHGTITGPWTTSKVITTTTGTASGTVFVSPSALSAGGRDFTAWLRALPSSYNAGHAGYQVRGRSFRFISSTLTVPPRILSADHLGAAVIELRTTCGSQCEGPFAEILVLPGGGRGSIQYQGFFTPGNFLVSPRAGDRLTISIYYDQRGHTFFTATDLTQHTTQTVRQAAGGINPVFDRAGLYAVVEGTVPPPAADTRLWQFTGTHLTTYGGVRGTVMGPWQASMLIKTSDGTPAAAVVAGPSRLSNGDQDFGVWLRHP